MTEFRAGALARRIAGHRRLVILRSLAETPAEQRERLLILALLGLLPAGTGNVSLLRDLSADAGAPIVRDRVDAHGAWLDDHGLVLRALEGDVVTLALTERGHEVATGRRGWPGVAPPTGAEWLHGRLAALAVVATLAEVEADLAWLTEAGLVRPGPLGEGWAAVLITPRGLDVVAGREVVEGVQRPAFGTALRTAARGAADLLRG